MGKVVSREVMGGFGGATREHGLILTVDLQALVEVADERDAETDDEDDRRIFVG